MAAAVSGRSKYLNSTIQIFSVSCFRFGANHPPTSLWQQQSAWPCGQCQQAARPWWASALMTRWLVSFSFLRKRLCNFIPIIVCFERFLDDCKKKKLRGQLNCFYSFFPPGLLSGALAVMVDRKEIKWTIYCLLWGWAQAGRGRRCGPREQDAVLLLFSAQRVKMLLFILFPPRIFSWIRIFVYCEKSLSVREKPSR